MYGRSAAPCIRDPVKCPGGMSPDQSFPRMCSDGACPQGGSINPAPDSIPVWCMSRSQLTGASCEPLGARVSVSARIVGGTGMVLTLRFLKRGGELVHSLCQPVVRGWPCRPGTARPCCNWSCGQGGLLCQCTSSLTSHCNSPRTERMPCCWSQGTQRPDLDHPSRVQAPAMQAKGFWFSGVCYAGR